MMVNFKTSGFVLLSIFVGMPSWAVSPEGLESLANELEKIATQGELVGLQVAVRAKSGLLFSGTYGTVSAGGGKKIR